MGKHPKLENLDYLFESNNEFSLTDKEYENLVEVSLPLNKNYLLNGSALARKCKELGFRLEVEENVIFMKNIKNY